MRKSRTFAVAALAVTSALALAGCGSNGGDTGGEDQITIALVSKGYQHQFWQTVKKGAEDKAKELGVTVTFEGPAAETEIDAQIQMLTTAIDKNPDAIGFAALDPDACVPAYDAAKAKEIPIIEFDAVCNSDYASSFVATDGVLAGGVAAEHMAELIDGKGKVAIVSHSQINSTGVERRDGFVKKMEADYPDIEIVDIQYGDGDHLKSADIAKAMLAANPDLAGIYSTNEGSAIGVVNGVKELGLEPGKVVLVGFDSGAGQINPIKEGFMAGAMTQDPLQIGARTVQAAYDVIMGKSVEKYYDTGAYWYDKTNLDDPKIAAVLYQ